MYGIELSFWIPLLSNSSLPVHSGLETAEIYVHPCMCALVRG